MNVLIRGKDDSVAIMTLAEGANVEEAVRKFKECHPNQYSNYKVVEDLKLPDYSTRDEWKLDKNWKIIVPE